MKTWNRICIKSAEVVAQNGDRHAIERGKEYLTSHVRKDGTVVVFGSFWTPFPQELFAGEERFT